MLEIVFISIWFQIHKEKNKVQNRFKLLYKVNTLRYND
jgi:hypothetical protein